MNLLEINIINIYRQNIYAKTFLFIILEISMPIKSQDDTKNYDYL